MVRGFSKKVRGIIKSHPNMAIPIAQGCEDVRVETFLIREDGGDEDLQHEATKSLYNFCQSALELQVEKPIYFGF